MNSRVLKSADEASLLAQAAFGILLLALILFGMPASAETMVEEVTNGDESAVSVEPVEPLSTEELGELVGPIALYPDDLIAIVLPASTYPLQVVQAARFLEARKDDASLKPADDWDDSIVALLNYPEVVELMNDDLDWTWKLGQAVLVQQEEVIAAVGDFRERARVAGNLKSDEHQTVELADDGAIEITPADPKVIYVPYYEPSRVTVYHEYPVYYYYPRAYPVYYYPYPAGYVFSSGFFWGVTTAFSIGWSTHHVHVHHYGYYGHPYYGRSYYYDRYYYRRPSLSVTYNYYNYDRRYHRTGYRHHEGNYWRPRHDRYGDRPRYLKPIVSDRTRYDRDRSRHDGSRDRYDGGRDGTIRHADRPTRQRIDGDGRPGAPLSGERDRQRLQVAEGSRAALDVQRHRRTAQLQGRKGDSTQRAHRNPARRAEAAPITRNRMVARDSRAPARVTGVSTRMAAAAARVGASQRRDRADTRRGRPAMITSSSNPAPDRSRALAPQRATAAVVARQSYSRTNRPQQAPRARQAPRSAKVASAPAERSRGADHRSARASDNRGATMRSRGASMRSFRSHQR